MNKNKRNRCWVCQGDLLPTAFGWVHEVTPKEPHRISPQFDYEPNTTRRDDTAKRLIESLGT